MHCLHPAACPAFAACAVAVCEPVAHIHIEAYRKLHERAKSLMTLPVALCELLVRQMLHRIADV